MLNSFSVVNFQRDAVQNKGIDLLVESSGTSESNPKSLSCAPIAFIMCHDRGQKLIPAPISAMTDEDS